MPRRVAPIRRSRRYVVAAVAIALVAIFGRPAAHLIGSAWRDQHAAPATAPPAGYVNDASRMSLTAIESIIDIPTDPAAAERQLANLFAESHRNRIPVSFAGARHSMGGHIAAPDGIVINMMPFNRFEVDDQGVLHAQAGARWDRIIPYLDQRGRSIAVMQSNNSFTVGGSISVNCHGWQANGPPIGSTVIALRVMKSDGSIVRCSREENSELFSLAIGGYGLFGVILEVELQTVPNERYEMRRLVLPIHELTGAFKREVTDNPTAGMAYARLCVSQEEFLQAAVLNVFERSPCDVAEIPALHETSLAGIKRAVFRGSAGSEYGKQLRWDAELALSDQLSQRFVSRNILLNDPVELYQDRSDQTTDILHEYFVPPEQFATFISQMQSIVPRHSLDLLNVTVRHVMEDRDAFLRYADREMLSLVLLFSQPRTIEADAAMQALTRELVDAVLECGGRHYLPYRLHATRAQFERAYPQAREFFEKKRQYDPELLFQNHFYLRYGR